MLNFNFQYIKNLASPGVWRRGYDYYQKKLVEKIELCEEGIIGQVKGNFRDEYKTLLKFSEDAVSASCDCPFPDEWCKHAVAVALIGISDGLWHKYWGIENPVDLDFQQEEENYTYLGNYKFLINDKSRPKTIALKVIERKTNTVITQIEPILKQVLLAQKQNIFDFNDKEKLEFNLLKFIYKYGQFDKHRQHFYIFFDNINELMPNLYGIEEIRHAETNKKYILETNPLKLTLNINLSMMGNVLLALHWKRTNPDDIIPYEEIKLFAKRIQWGVYQNIFFPIETKVGDLPHFLSKSSFLDIRGADGARFLFEQLPKIKKNTDGEFLIEEDISIQKARLEKNKPIKVLILELPDDNTLRVSLEFEYDGIRVPYSDTAKEAPYVCIAKSSVPQKQYSVEEFREQEAAKLKADIEAGLVDPSQIEKKKKKVVKIKVLNKEKLVKNFKSTDTLFEKAEASEASEEINLEDSLEDNNNEDGISENIPNEVNILIDKKQSSSSSMYPKPKSDDEFDLMDIVLMDKPMKIDKKKVSKEQVQSKPIVEEATIDSLIKQETEDLEKPKKKRGRPPKQASMSIDEISETIRTKVDSEKNTNNSEQSKEDIYWVRRDLETENQAYKLLVNSCLTPVQTNKLSASEDDVIDFVAKYLPRFKEDFVIEAPEELEDIKISEKPFKFSISFDFADKKDAFYLEIVCKVGKNQISLTEIQELLQKGRKYVYARGCGYVEIPLADMLQLTKTLNTFDALKLTETKFRVHTYKVGLITELIDQNVDIIMSDEFNKFWDLISSFSAMEDIEVPNNIHADLREYQKKGFTWLYFLYTYGLNGILADDMGLGKTLQSLTLLQKINNDFGEAPSLIVCPTSVVFNWEDEIQKFAPDLKVLNFTGSGRHSLANRFTSNDVVITSYALIRRDIDILKRYNFRYIILDESQKIKNYQSLTASVSKQLKSSHRLALSGTPIENRLSELWSVFDFLMPGFLHDLSEYKYRYIQPIEENNNKDAEKRLKSQVYPFILRRLKENVAKDLPDKLEFVHYCEMLPEQQDIYVDILDRTREEIFRKIERDGFAKSQMSILSALLRLRQVCCHPKLIGDVHKSKIRNSGKFEELKDMIKEVIEQKHRILLFSQFVEMLNIIREWLIEEGIPFEYLTGSTQNRKECVDNFNNNAKIPIFLISLKAGGTGLNLTGADYVIHYDPWWNPAVEDQATDRAHRIGQTKKVFVYRMITKGSVEEKIIKLQEKKRDLIDSVITVDTSLSKILSYEDLKEILTPGF